MAYGTRQRRAICFAAALLALSLHGLAGRALAQPGQLDANPPVANATEGVELLCPQHVGLGEPFLLRLRSEQPLRLVAVAWMGRQAPLDVRGPNDAGKAGVKAGHYEAIALLGTDVAVNKTGPRELSVVAVVGGRRRLLRTTIAVEPVVRPVERLTLPPDMVNPPESELGRIAREAKLTAEALAGQGDQRLWDLPLSWPVPDNVSSIYGIGRVLNGQKRGPHKGLDLEAVVGDPVHAAADGVVVLVGDFYYAGRCVFVDHGQGVVTEYAHLSEVRVRSGARLARGQVLGLAGNTGRSTRSHLHFGVSVLGRLVDPELLLRYRPLTTQTN